MLNGRTVPSSGESALDARLCAELGAQLARARETRGLTAPQVGERLLLSTRQVTALESVDFSAFHNATFYLAALRKYATFADVDPKLVETIAAGLVKPDPNGIMLVPADSSDEANDSSSRRLLSAFAMLAAVALLAGGGFYLAQTRSSGAAAASATTASSSAATAPTTAAPAPAPTPTVASTPAVVPAADSAQAPEASATPTAAPVPDPQAFGTLRVLHPSWIFVRDAESVVTERSLAVGEIFTIETQPTYLAVGTSDAELTIGSGTVDVSKFVTNGQIRIRAGDFDALVQGVSPIQAPTLAARP